jgi:hypothetical protein
VGCGDPIMPMKTARQIPRPQAEYIIIFLRPNLSIVLGRRNDPIAKIVFMTAARSWEIVEEMPICEKIVTL